MRCFRMAASTWALAAAELATGSSATASSLLTSQTCLCRLMERTCVAVRGARRQVCQLLQMSSPACTRDPKVGGNPPSRSASHSKPAKRACIDDNIKHRKAFACAVSPRAATASSS